MHLTTARRLTIGGVEALGGLWGFGFTAGLLVNAPTASTRLFYGGLCLYFGVAFIAGVLLIRAHPMGAQWSEWIQYPQLVYVLSPPLTYHAYVGFAVNITANGALDLGLSGEWGGTFQFAIDKLLPVSTVGVNVLAVLALWQLREHRRVQLVAEQATPQPGTV